MEKSFRVMRAGKWDHKWLAETWPFALHGRSRGARRFDFTLVPDGGDKDYPTTLKVLDDYFIPKAKVPFARHLFGQITQSSEETVDQFVCRLRQRAASCDFGEWEDEYIRDQLIDKCYSAKLRRKFFEKDGSVTLNDLLITARVQEAVDLTGWVSWRATSWNLTSILPQNRLHNPSVGSHLVWGRKWRKTFLFLFLFFFCGEKLRWVASLWDHRRSTRGTNQLGLSTCCSKQTWWWCYNLRWHEARQPSNHWRTSAHPQS